MIISHVQSHDAGRYTCICNTDDGQPFVSEYELNVEEEQAKNEIKPTKVEYAEVGSSITLKCNTDRYPIRYHWSRQHGQFSAGQDIASVSLSLFSIRCSSRCVISNYLISVTIATCQCAS